MKVAAQCELSAGGELGFSENGKTANVLRCYADGMQAILAPSHLLSNLTGLLLPSIELEQMSCANQLAKIAVSNSSHNIRGNLQQGISFTTRLAHCSPCGNGYPRLVGTACMLAALSSRGALSLDLMPE